MRRARARCVARFRSGATAFASACVLALVPALAQALPGASVAGELSYAVEAASTTVNGICWLQNPGHPSCITDNGTTLASDSLPNSPAPFSDAISYPGLGLTRAVQDLVVGETGVVAAGSHRAEAG